MFTEEAQGAAGNITSKPNGVPGAESAEECADATRRERRISGIVAACERFSRLVSGIGKSENSSSQIWLGRLTTLTPA
jgi:hypothetical protein